MVFPFVAKFMEQETGSVKQVTMNQVHLSYSKLVSKVGNRKEWVGSDSSSTEFILKEM